LYFLWIAIISKTTIHDKNDWNKFQTNDKPTQTIGINSNPTKCAEPTALLRCANPVGMIHIVATDFNPLNRMILNKWNKN
jgi:hypothetical protein